MEVRREDCQAAIPCHNEAGRIAPVVRATLRQVAAVLVVDDGSTDTTAEEARRAGAEVRRLAPRHGKGLALRNGWRVLADRGVRWAICLDGDGQHSPDDIPHFLSAASRTGADLVVGNRFATPPAMPWLRRTTNRSMSRILGALAGRRFPDSQCGFRLLRLDRLGELRLETERFEIESETLLSAARVGWCVEFVPIAAAYGTGDLSKIQPIADTWRWLRWLSRSLKAPGCNRPRSAP